MNCLIKGNQKYIKNDVINDSGLDPQPKPNDISRIIGKI